ncbi:MAG: AI-2E family transporter [Fusicatenibacter saccharivorans]
MRTAFHNVLNILSPLIAALILAYVISPIINFIEQRIIARLFARHRKTQSVRCKKLVRALLILLTYVAMLFALYGLIATLIPELFSSIANIVSNFSNYANNIQDFATKVLANYPEMQQTADQYISTFSAKLSNWLTNDLMPMLRTFLLNLSGQLVNMVTFFKNILLGAIVAIYMLYNKESYIAKLKKAVYALLGLDHGNAVIRDCQYVNQEFSGFLVGKVIDSIIIGAICYLVTSLIGTPYALLVSVIIGVTNIIPFFGPFLGAVPCLLLILLIDPLQALYFLIFVVLLQQFDGNFLGPKILGETTGVSSFLIIISILIGGGFWGVFGMIIAVPVCAIICTVCRNFANRRLEKYHLPDDDAFYFHMDHIDPETRQAIPYQKKKIDEAEVFHFPGYRLRKALTKLTTEESPVDAPYTPAKPSTEEKNSDSSDSDQK